MVLLSNLIVLSGLTLLWLDAAVHAKDHPPTVRTNTSYQRAIALEAGIICFSAKGADHEDLISYGEGFLEVAQMTPFQFKHIRRSKYFQQNWKSDVVKEWNRQGGCDEMWREYQSFLRHYGQSKPQLKGDDPSKPFQF